MAHLVVVNVFEEHVRRQVCEDIVTLACDPLEGASCVEARRETACRASHATVEIERVGTGTPGWVGPSGQPAGNWTPPYAWESANVLVGTRLSLKVPIAAKTYHPLGWGRTAVVEMPCSGDDPAHVLFEPILEGEDGNQYVTTMSLATGYGYYRFPRPPDAYVEAAGRVSVPAVPLDRIALDFPFREAGLGVVEEQGSEMIYRTLKVFPLDAVPSRARRY